MDLSVIQNSIEAFDHLLSAGFPRNGTTDRSRFSSPTAHVFARLQERNGNVKEAMHFRGSPDSIRCPMVAVPAARVELS